MSKPYYSKSDIAKARELDLLTYLQAYEPDELVKNIIKCLLNKNTRQPENIKRNVDVVVAWVRR